MIIARFAEERRLELRQRMNDLADALSQGNVATIEEYRGVVGEIRGLAIAERMLLDGAEKMEKLDD